MKGKTWRHMSDIAYRSNSLKSNVPVVPELTPPSSAQCLRMTATTIIIIMAMIVDDDDDDQRTAEIWREVPPRSMIYELQCLTATVHSNRLGFLKRIRFETTRFEWRIHQIAPLPHPLHPRPRFRPTNKTIFHVCDGIYRRV